MGRKYLEDAGIHYHEASLEGEIGEKYQRQREVYGFDQSETWSLKHTFKVWLFERLSMYNEVNIIDTRFHLLEYKGEKLTFQDCIDRMLNGLRLELTGQGNPEMSDDVLKLFVLCYPYLWW